MTKISRCIFLSIFLVFCFTSTADAQLKLDFGRLANKVTDMVGRISGIAADVQKQVEHVKTYLKSLDGAKEGLAKIKKLKDDAQAKIAAVKDKIDSTISQVKDTAAAVTSKVQETAASVKSQVQNAMDTAQSNIQGATGPAQELITAQTSLARSKSECEAKIKNLEATRDASINKYKENNKVLEEKLSTNPEYKDGILARIEENNKKIAELEEDCAKTVAQTRAVHDEINQQYEEKINQLKSAAMNVDPLSNINADSAKKALSGMFGGDAGGAMNEIIANNFYAAGEETSSDRNAEISNYRRDTLLKDTSEVLTQASKIMSAGDSEIEYAKNLQNNVQTLETDAAKLMAVLSQNLGVSKVLIKYARLLVADMKMITAKDMISLDKKLNNYNKDVTIFNLDDYEYKD